jgi:hypothetical protein
MNLFDSFEQSRGQAEERIPTPPCNPDNAEKHAYGKFPSLAMVYSPAQEFRDTYTPADALAHGTLFVGLDKPFEAYTWR